MADCALPSAHLPSSHRWRGAIVSTAESSDDYSGLVAILNRAWRVVACRDRIQWILQYRGSPKKPRRDDWRARSYCRTSEALRRCAREHAGAIRPEVAVLLDVLPDVTGECGMLCLPHPDRGGVG
jgi:hypothetical protein